VGFETGMFFCGLGLLTFFVPGLSLFTTAVAIAAIITVIPNTIADSFKRPYRGSKPSVLKISGSPSLMD
jgi:hypothetical protein